MRAVFAALFIVVSLIAGAWIVRLTHAPTDEQLRTAVDTIHIAAPRSAVWEQIINIDTIAPAERVAGLHSRFGFPQLIVATLEHPRQGVMRMARYEGGFAYREFLYEWEDGEHLKIATWEDTTRIPTGLEPRKPMVGLHSFALGVSTWDLDSAGENGTRLIVTTKFRATTWANVSNDWWSARVMHNLQENLLATMKSRSERVEREKVPYLTAEMRDLHNAIIDRSFAIAEGYASLPLAEASIFNAERHVESLGGVSHRAGETLDDLDIALRTLLSSEVPRARTIAWVLSGAAIGYAGAAGGDDTVRIQYEDRQGRCVDERISASTKGAGTLVLGKPKLARCEIRVLAEAIRRGRVLARVPLHAGDLADSWSLALAVRGRVEVYRDSVVVRADSVMMRSKAPDETPVILDSISFALGAHSGNSWYAVKHGSILKIHRTLAVKQEMTRTRVRFSVPIDSTFALHDAWPMFEANLSVPKTKDNPSGLAWTYTHSPEAMLKSIPWPPAPWP